MSHRNLLLGLLLLSTNSYAQDDLLSELESNNEPTTTFVEYTFKSSRIINGHSVEMRDAGVLEFLISHRFGRLNEGIQEFFGLDDSNIRLGLELGVTPDLNIGIGRSSLEKQYDGFIKYRFLKQRTGQEGFPFTAVAFASIAINTLEDLPDQDLNFKNRSNYTYQLLIARKFSSNFSMQLTPTLVHKNLVVRADDDNDLIGLGIGVRQKVSNRVSINAEYFQGFNLPEDLGLPDDPGLHNALALGVDIETGGHVFQLHITNSRAMIEKGFITETDGDFFGGDLHFGFNISRVFNVGKQDKDWD